MIPNFDYVPAVGGVLATLRVVTVSGVSTKHGSTATDRGRMYAEIDKPGDYRLRVYSDLTKSTLALSGTTPTLQTTFALTGAGANGMSGNAVIETYTAPEPLIVLLPTFATDRDVFIEPQRAAAMPGFDPKYGLANWHAKAMQQILAGDLPRAVPHLFGGTGLATFLPSAAAVTLPALSKIANADQLRIAQGNLVRALSAEEVTTEEFRQIAADARSRYADAMNALGEANLADEDEDVDVNAGKSLTVSTWRRG